MLSRVSIAGAMHELGADPLPDVNVKAAAVGATLGGWYVSSDQVLPPMP
jgi:hypothetical protein